MSKNLSISLDSFRREWEESYLANRRNCEHHDSRFNEGEIPLSAEPFSSALGRFQGKTELARKIVEALEKDGGYVFKQHGFMGIDYVEPALKEIMFNIPQDIEWLIADYGASPLMLDRKAFTTDGSLIESYIQWYISRKKI